MARNQKATDTQNANENANESAARKGRKVILPNGEARVDYIKRRYYEDGVKRGDIARELSEMVGEKVPYQVVFAATKPQKTQTEGEGGNEGDGDGDSGSESS